MYLSAEEFNSLKRDFPFTDKVLDKLSAYLYNFSYKSEKNHYAQLYKWLLNERNQGSDFSSFADASSGKKAIQPDPDASYDIVRAEERARKSVPTKIKYKDGRIYDLKKKEYVQLALLCPALLRYPVPQPLFALRAQCLGECGRI